MTITAEPEFGTKRSQVTKRRFSFKLHRQIQVPFHFQHCSHGAIFHILCILAPTRAIPLDKIGGISQGESTPSIRAAPQESRQFRGSNKLFMAAPCASLGSLLTYLPLSLSPPPPPFSPLARLPTRLPPPPSFFPCNSRVTAVTFRRIIGPYMFVSVLSSLHKRINTQLREREKEESERKAREGKRSMKKGDAGRPSWEQPSAGRACQVAVYINFIADF